MLGYRKVGGSMTYKFNGEEYILRFQKGELLVEELLSFAREQSIKSAWLSGLGGLSWAEIGFYNLPSRKYAWRKLDELLELTNLSGNIAIQNSQPILHAHVTVSNSDFMAYGGHLKEALVGGTVELYLRPLDMEIERTEDQDTGLKILDI